MRRPNAILFAGPKRSRSCGEMQERLVEMARRAGASGVVLSLARLALRSTVQPGPGGPVGGYRRGAPCACSEHPWGFRPGGASNLASFHNTQGAYRAEVD